MIGKLLAEQAAASAVLRGRSQEGPGPMRCPASGPQDLEKGLFSSWVGTG